MVSFDSSTVEIKDDQPAIPVLNWSKITKINPAKFAKKQVENPDDCAYHVICGSFSILENAQNRKEELISKGYTAQVIIGSKLNYVSSSCHLDRSAAVSAGELMKSKDGFSSWILKR